MNMPTDMIITQNENSLNELDTTISVKPFGSWGANERMKKLKKDVLTKIIEDIENEFKVKITHGQKYKINPFIKCFVGYCLDSEENNDYFESIEITEPSITFKHINENENFIWISITSSCMCGEVGIRVKNNVNSHHWN